LSRFWRDERGATAVEYGMMVALISVALMGVWGALSGSIGTSFSKLSATLATANDAK
jgi:pilus assembly protein Flp/PilA